MASELQNDIYAKVFVSASLEREALTDLICQYSAKATRARFSEINTDELSLDVRRNDDYDPLKDSFINYRYYVDVNPFIGVDKNGFLKALSQLMIFLKRRGLPAVAACDWEDELENLVNAGEPI